MAIPKQEKDMDQQPFLDKEPHDWNSNDSRSSTVDGDDLPSRAHPPRHSPRWAILFHIFLILTYTAIFTYITKAHFQGSDIRPCLTYCNPHLQQALYSQNPN